MKPIILSVPTFRPYRKESSASLSHQLASSRLNPFAPVFMPSTTTAVTESPAAAGGGGGVSSLPWFLTANPPSQFTPIKANKKHTADTDAAIDHTQRSVSVYERRAEIVVVPTTKVEKSCQTIESYLSILATMPTRPPPDVIFRTYTVAQLIEYGKTVECEMVDAVADGEEKREGEQTAAKKRSPHKAKRTNNYRKSANRGRK
ncbi:unnamed protein product [Vitrella brassicaformis CCMP3155]|uniref:Uncharacterized protein n=1 Tax=Vitrella brassicaformis (strain CCMP3155) TaxID=1169540 RepID=A0A0G4H834_VITBC|nr:unnamed protein product [Vitrella brassicaformis CCMP3155]|eukprot:CEM39962.1 unnamed protein product [Vitrella brassicaformis CCMP3155]